MTLSPRAKALIRARSLGITLAQLTILQILSESDLYHRQLQLALDTDHGSVQKWLRLLVDGGLVKRKRVVAATGDKGAPYSALICITTKGRKVLEMIWGHE